MSSEDIQGDEWDAYVALERTSRDERGIANGTRVLWRRRPRSSRRSNDRPGRTGKPFTSGEGGQVIRTPRLGRYAKWCARSAEGEAFQVGNSPYAVLCRR
jgi:hypothetical protein